MKGAATTAIIFALAWSISSEKSAKSEASNTSFQCGHWALLRSCELTGTAVDSETVLSLLSPRPSGHSLLELSQAFTHLGYRTTAVKQDIEDLRLSHLPAVVHFTIPDHFVVVSQIGSEAVSIFDGAGRRKMMPMSEFLERWDGVCLLLERDLQLASLPPFSPDSMPPVPRIRFDQLYVDLGEIPGTGEVISVRFPVRNVGQENLNHRARSV